MLTVAKVITQMKVIAQALGHLWLGQTLSCRVIVTILVSAFDVVRDFTASADYVACTVSIIGNVISILKANTSSVARIRVCN